MLSIKHAKFALQILMPLFIAVISICVCATFIPDTKFVNDSIESLDDSKTTIMEFTGATIATSLAISALPDDFATPLADTLANMNQYFVLILIVLFLERLIVVEGIKISFIYVIPIACLLYILSTLIKKDRMKHFAYKVAILGIALVLVVPCSTHFTNIVGADYLAYVEETITETGDGANKINEVMATSDDGDQTIFEKLSDAFKTAIQGITDLLEYFKNVIKKCMNSIAILVVTTIVMPLLTLFFFRWLLNELFKISLPMPHMRSIESKNNAANEKEMVAIEETKE